MDNSVIFEDARRVVSHADLTPITGKKALITGATGLIGTYILYSIGEFVKRGNAVDKVYAVTMNGLPEHLKDLEGETWLEVLKGDLSDDAFLDSLPCADVIIHAAGYGQPAKFVVDESKTIKLNTYVTFKLLDLLNDGGKFLFVSSSGIYNGLDKPVFSEEDVGTTNTLHPRACYIEGKRCGEAICNSYRKKGVDAKSARVSYSYGPGIRKTDERALYSFIKKGFSGNIALLDDGSAQRIYCYITDVVEMLFDILLYGKEPLYNVGGKDIITIYELASLIAGELGASVTLPEVSAAVPGNAKVERLSIEKVQKEFGRDKFIDIHEGVRRTIKWMENYR